MAIKYITKRTTSVESVVNALLLTEFDDHELVEKVVKTWTPKQKIWAYEWAAREILAANDNDVRRLKCPVHVERLKNASTKIKSTNS